MTTRREINGNGTHSGKRRSGRDKKTGEPVNFNCGKPGYNNFENLTNYPYYPNGQNMFPAVSDPSLFYPYMNYQMPFEPVSLPAYNFFQPYSYRNHSCNMFGSPVMSFCKSQDSDQEFTSLPCMSNDLSEAEKRRLSDPGIPNLECDASDTTRSEHLVRNLIDQVNYLKDSNRRLCREIQEMRSEMNFLKQQLGGRFYEKEYEPGMLSDIVREIRDAARVREEALLSRVKHMIDEKQLAMNHLHSVTEKARNNDRILKLEEQMKALCMNNSSRVEEVTNDASASAEQVLELEQDTLLLRRELQEAIAGKKNADARIQQLDQMLTTLRQRYAGTDLLLSSDDVKTTSSVDNCSLTTKSASPVARIVVSGPVTSL